MDRYFSSQISRDFLEPNSKQNYLPNNLKNSRFIIDDCQALRKELYSKKTDAGETKKFL
jgi:hypothetical protein